MSSASDTIRGKELHVLTRAGDALAAETIARQQAKPGGEVQVFDLTRGEPDYDALLEAVFAADSIAVW